MAPIVIAHRGASAYRPELGRSALLLAVEQGAQAVEIDVVAAADGVLVVRHERALRTTTDVADRPEFAARARRTASGRREWFAEDFTAGELTTLGARERLPAIRPESARHDGEDRVLLLRDVLELTAAAGVLLVIEVKDAAASTARGLDPVPLLQRELAAAPRLPRIVFESFEKAPLRALRAFGPTVYLINLVGTAPDERRGGGPSYRRELARAAFDGFTGVSLPVRLLRADRVDALHRRGLTVWTWTLRAENRFTPSAWRSAGGAGALGDWRGYWGSVLDTGLDGAFVDQPDLLARLVAERG